MASIIQSLSNLFASRKSRSRRIAKVCAKSLKDPGLNIGGNVYQLTNSKGKAGWLISLQVSERFYIPPTDALALRIYLSRKIEEDLGLKPKSLGLVLSFNQEAKRLPFAENVVNSKWVRARIPVWQEGRPGLATTAASAAGGPASTFPPSTLRPAKPLPEILRPNANVIGSAPISLPAKEQEQRLEKLMESMGDDEEYEVMEASMTDFDQALTSE